VVAAAGEFKVEAALAGVLTCAEAAGEVEIEAALARVLTRTDREAFTMHAQTQSGSIIPGLDHSRPGAGVKMGIW
jgi:hypothetical protein